MDFLFELVTCFESYIKRLNVFVFEICLMNKTIVEFRMATSINLSETKRFVINHDWYLTIFPGI